MRAAAREGVCRGNRKRAVSAGAQIVSGMAYGIDCCSQKAALEAGSSYAVLGGGVDICYPRENIGLYEKLIRQGGVISEMRPKTRSIPFFFRAETEL